MADRGPTPVFTENFTRNIETIRGFLGTEGDIAFSRFLDRLFDDIIPTICRFPQSGRPFLVHAPHSVETQTRLKRLRGRLQPDDDLREFILDDYLLLYLRRGHRLIFLALKHHRQLSFDLDQFWR
jgi:plasmid stabilization system protein ParE